MWFQHKETKLVWEAEGELAERLSLSPDFEEVDAPRTGKETTSEKDASSEESTETNEKSGGRRKKEPPAEK